MRALYDRTGASRTSILRIVAASCMLVLGLAALPGSDAQEKGGKQALTFLVTAVVVFGAVFLFDQVGWWRQPALGLPLIGACGVSEVVKGTATCPARMMARYEAAQNSEFDQHANVPFMSERNAGDGAKVLLRAY